LGDDLLPSNWVQKRRRGLEVPWQRTSAMQTSLGRLESELSERVENIPESSLKRALNPGGPELMAGVRLARRLCAA